MSKRQHKNINQECCHFPQALLKFANFGGESATWLKGRVERQNAFYASILLEKTKLVHGSLVLIMKHIRFKCLS